MDVSQLSNTARYGIVIAAVIVAMVVASGATLATDLPGWFLFGYLAAAVFVVGVEWDRIYIHGRTL